MKIGPTKLVPEESTDSIGNNVRMLARYVEDPGLVGDVIGHGSSWLPWSHNHPLKYHNQGAQVEMIKPIGVHKDQMMDPYDVDELDQCWVYRIHCFLLDSGF